jgi:hypothetical protein
MTAIELHDHEAAQFYWDAETEHCPHKPIPERDTDAWDQWMCNHQPYDDGILCRDAPAGTACPACSAELGDMIPWSRCRNRKHTKARQLLAEPQHRPVTVTGGDLECLERECEDFFTDDGDEIPGKTECSHLYEMQICEACSEPPDADEFPPVVAWADCKHKPDTIPTA